MTTTWAGPVPSAWPTSRRFERVGWHSRCYSAATPHELPARSGRLRSAPAACRLAGRRAAGSADRHELGGGRRALDPARRRVRRDVPARGARHGAGARPLGWYTGRLSPNTRRLVVEEGGFLYDADAYNDDLPYWVEVAGGPHLVVPYTLDNNDMKFGTLHGFSTGDEFFTYLRDAFDVLYAEGGDRPKMMSVGLHMRLVGRPGRIGALARFLVHVQRHEGV